MEKKSKDLCLLLLCVCLCVHVCMCLECERCSETELQIRNYTNSSYKVKTGDIHCENENRNKKDEEMTAWIVVFSEYLQ